MVLEEEWDAPNVLGAPFCAGVRYEAWLSGVVFVLGVRTIVASSSPDASRELVVTVPTTNCYSGVPRHRYHRSPDGVCLVFCL